MMRRSGRAANERAIACLSVLGNILATQLLLVSTLPAADISGQVRYFGSGIPVEGVSLDLIGPASDTTTTAADGAFAFTGVPPGAWQLVPSSSLSLSNGVGALDAAFALLQHSGSISLGAEAQLACDVDASGNVDDADASAILEFRVGSGDNGTPIAAEDKTTSTGASNFLLYALPSADAELRISRTGSSFALYYRQIGAETWILQRQHNRPEIPASVWVGMMVYAANSPANIEVWFDQIDCF